MEIVDKATILADVWLNAEGEAVDSFRQVNDLGLPYAFGIAYGHILQMSAEGEQQVEDAWESLCYMLEVDANKDYADFEHMVLTAQA